MAPHVPRRTCAGCRQHAGKPELLRIARTGESFGLDVSGSAPGRGAYVHRDAGCVEAALGRGGLARALRTGLREDEVGRLQSEIEGQMGAS